MQHAHADAAAAGGRLEHYRIADLRRRFDCRVRIRAGPVPGASGSSSACGEGAGAVLFSAERRGYCPASARIKAMPAAGAGLGEVGLLREEAIARIDRIGAGVPRGGENARSVEITFRGRAGADPHGDIGLGDVARSLVGASEKAATDRMPICA